MHEPLVPAPLVFRDDGTPYSPRHDDIYHSAAGALSQARHVFLNGNGLPERWRGKPRFNVLETGFGMGINFLATWAAWRIDPQRPAALHFISVEKYPFNAADLRRAHAAIFDDASVMPLADTLAAAWPVLVTGIHRIELEQRAVTLTLAFGDVIDVMPRLKQDGTTADAIYLDGFAPARNPDMWTPALFASLAAIASDDASFATYTSAGQVKRALLQNGFEYRKVRGFGGKRAMLVGKRASVSDEIVL
ncbi:tRNA (5-methylaminomethyl-2-thiouridine)(34)-methyltransferase MnmD [Caballeronia sp. LZ034LL]|uniref:tRNA (5-methylaminomethyl-2-thiouridine)(34)-methyltransferase MnmD n=1 Tax=Caballeronia sp. LZ034LL TaxID=3038567 RepID=UPI002861C885|nr:tRNA (5-methylaminomethyl-2-thiouridine)(34)-methyltransferase MnmD [Caballeronia sp. LZ034LL]MDR5836793.1 tRNA (5-methylaminomethyl-2-thiouridine)(34)-methyltransferase MnmD [Caballeronia sp. LZ034LL]